MFRLVVPGNPVQMPIGPHLPQDFDSASISEQLRVESGPVEPGVFVISVRGEVDIASAPVLGDELDGVLDKGPREVLVDIDGVTFMDATMLNLLLQTHQRALAMGAALRVRCSGSHDRSLFTLVGLDYLLD